MHNGKWDASVLESTPYGLDNVIFCAHQQPNNNGWTADEALSCRTPDLGDYIC